MGQQGPAWLRWLDRYAQEHAATVAQIAVRDFPPMVRAQITQEADGETMTASNMQLIVTLLARVGAAHGLRQVPFTVEDIVALTQALVLDNALTTLHADAIIGTFSVDDPATGRAGVLGDALARWLAAVRAAPSAPPPKKRRRCTRGDERPGWRDRRMAAGLLATPCGGTQTRPVPRGLDTAEHGEGERTH